MQIIVNHMPETPEECVFSAQRRHPRGGSFTVCTLRPYIEKAGSKPICLCKDVRFCDRLKTIEEAIHGN